MVAHVSGERMKQPLVPLAAFFVGGAFALVAVAAPSALLDTVFSETGNGSWIPLNWSEVGRPTLAFATGAMGSGIGALAALIVSVPRTTSAAPLMAEEDVTRIPIIRRADAHPDPRDRAPLRGEQDLDLPTPEFAALSQSSQAGLAERDLPADLDQPLAAFDPAAIPSVPLPPPVPPRRERMASPGARGGLPRESAEALVRPETDATVHALLDRLERGVVRRNHGTQARIKARPERGPEDALASLRNLARQA